MFIPLSSFPTINASLNFLSAIFLITGYIAIRRKNEELHKRLMLAAVATSTAFLICYLYYHFHHGSQKYTTQGLLRTVYFSILISHTILAATVPFLVGKTLYHAYRRHWEKHKKIAQLTFPIWLYVSITGVIIYVMLYIVQ